MDAVEVLSFEEELVSAHVPCHVSGVRHDLGELGPGNETSGVFLEVAFILER